MVNIEKEFDEKFDKKMRRTKGENPDVACYNDGYNCRVAENWQENKQIKQFIKQKIKEVIETVPIGEYEYGFKNNPSGDVRYGVEVGWHEAKVELKKWKANQLKKLK